MSEDLDDDGELDDIDDDDDGEDDTTDDEDDDDTEDFDEDEDFLELPGAPCGAHTARSACTYLRSQ